MKRRTLIFTIMIAALAFAVTAGASGFERRHGGSGNDFGPGAGLYRLIQDPQAAKAAGISDDQVAKLKALLPKHREEMKSLGAKSREARDNFRELMETGKADETSLRAAAKELTDAQADRLDLIVTHHMEIAKILTADQRAKLRDMIPPRARGGAGRGQGQGPDDGDGDDPLFD